MCQINNLNTYKRLPLECLEFSFLSEGKFLGIVNQKNRQILWYNSKKIPGSSNEFKLSVP